MAAIVVWGGNALLFGYGIGAARNDELGFALRHPVIATDIGKYKHGSTNISTNCVRFSTTLGLNERYGANKGEGSQVNAVRHALWSVAITSKYDESIAMEATNSHESNPNLMGSVFGDSLSADCRADILNNEIGRVIGSKRKGGDLKALTEDILNYYHEDGMWVTDRQSDGNWAIRREKLSDQQYIMALEELYKCDSDGYQPGERG